MDATPAAGLDLAEQLYWHQFLREQIRRDDIACRYGGEEFTLILPGASPQLAQERAEHVRTNVHALTVDFAGQRLAAVTLSLGVAVFTIHGQSGQAVLDAADAALYQQSYACALGASPASSAPAARAVRQGRHRQSRYRPRMAERSAAESSTRAQSQCTGSFRRHSSARPQRGQALISSEVRVSGMSPSVQRPCIDWHDFWD